MSEDEWIEEEYDNSHAQTRTDGPVKVRNANNTATSKEDEIANALERDMNHFLTTIDTEYYPDTDRMLLMLGLGETVFRK